MRILLTGSTGSLGIAMASEIRRRFPNADLLTPRREELDLLDAQKTHKFICDYLPTHVVHLAAQVFGIQGHRNFPVESLMKNTQIDLNLFSSLALYPPKWIYYASTVAAYGFPFASVPLVESELLIKDPHESEYGYAMSKRFGETYLHILKETYQTPYAYGLMTNLYGPGDRYLEGNGHVLISMATKATQAKTEGKPLLIWGDGTATRDFLSTSSAAKIIGDLFDQDVRRINLGSGVEISIATLAKMVEEVFELEHGIQFTGENQGITRRFSNVEKLNRFSATSRELDPVSEIFNFFDQFKAMREG